MLSFALWACVFMVSSDELGRGSCGWNQQYFTCEADFKPICAHLQSRKSDADWNPQDVVTLDLLNEHCSYNCYEIDDEDECNLMIYESYQCEWLTLLGDEEGYRGSCGPKTLEGYEMTFARTQSEKYSGEELSRSFMLNMWRYEKFCRQKGLRNQATCEANGKPCMWQGNACLSDPLLMLSWYAPDLAEFYAPDQHCILFTDPQDCLNQANFNLRDFAMLPEPLWPLYAGLFGGLFGLIFIIYLCRVSPRSQSPLLRQGPRRRFAQLFS